MSREISDEKLMAYLEGDLPTEEASEIQEQLDNSALLRERLKGLQMLLQTMAQSVEASPPPEVEWGFKAALQQEMAGGSSGVTLQWWQIAAAVALLIVGFASGRLTVGDAPNGELVALQSEVSSLRQAVMQRTLQSPSASERIHAVNLIEEEVSTPSTELLRTLINTVKGDKSPNVRYAAVEALEPYRHLEEVRLELVNALESQTDPLLQLAIIDWLVQAEEQAAIGAIKKIIDNESTSEEVKQQGQLAIDILI